MKLKVKVKGAARLHKAYDSDSGFDMRAAEDAKIGPGKVKSVRTKVNVDMRDVGGEEMRRRLEELGMRVEAQVRSRSGLSKDYFIFVVNSPGTIDMGHIGEVDVILANLGKKTFRIAPGDRIAQLVFAPVFSTVEIESVAEIRSRNIKEREFKGLGSSGIK